MEQKFVNLSYLEEVADGDQDMIKELVQIFIDQLPEFIEGFDLGLKEGDWLKIASIAHKAKSSVVSMGLTELGNKDLKNLELLAKQRRVFQLQSSATILDSERAELDSLSKMLQDYTDERIIWIKENSNYETIQELIQRFNKVINEATKELNVVLSNY